MYRVLLSMGFSRQEYWSGLPFPLQGILLTQGLNLGLLQCRHILYHLSHQGNLGVVGGCGLVPKLYLTLATPWTVATRLLCPQDSPGKNTGVGCHFLYRGSSRPKDLTWVSCIAGGFCTDWATREASKPELCGIETIDIMISNIV